MTDLKQLLTEVAGQAPAYRVKEQALAAARKRQRTRRLVPAAAGVAVIAAIGVSLFVPRPGQPPESVGKPWLPTRIEKPSQPPPKLPADRGVGRGWAVYSPCAKPSLPATCREYVITEEGTHYLIPGSSDKYGNEDDHATLSPDGRWLGVTRPGEFQLRDLTGTKVRTVEGDRLVPLAWSPDGRWLVIGPSGVGPDPEPIWRLDTRTGATRQVTAPFRLISWFVIDVTRVGEVLVSVPDARCRERIPMCDPHRDGVGEVALLDPDRGGQPIWTRRFEQPPPPDDPGKKERVEAMRLTPDDGSLLVALGKSVEFPDGGAWVATSGDLALFDLATGEQTRRYDIIDGTVIFDGPESRSATGGTVWELFAYDSDKILLRGVTSGEAPGETETGRVDTRIAVVDNETGEQRIITRAPDIKVIAVRGSTMLAG